MIAYRVQIKKCKPTKTTRNGTMRRFNLLSQMLDKTDPYTK